MEVAKSTDQDAMVPFMDKKSCAPALSAPVHGAFLQTPLAGINCWLRRVSAASYRLFSGILHKPASAGSHRAQVLTLRPLVTTTRTIHLRACSY